MMNDLLSIGILPVVLTLFAFWVGQQCPKKFKLSVFNPILISMMVVILVMALTGLEQLWAPGPAMPKPTISLNSPPASIMAATP